MINSDEKLEFDIGEGEESATVTISEDTEGKTTSTVESGPNAEELDQYSDKVKKRIDKLTARLRETERREQSALEYAKSVQARATQLEQQYMSVDTERLGEATGRVQTQVVALKQIIRKAREEGDIDTETEAQQRLTSLTVEQSQIAYATQQREQQTQQWTQQQQTAAQQPQVQVQQEVDPRVEDWAERSLNLLGLSHRTGQSLGVAGRQTIVEVVLNGFFGQRERQSDGLVGVASSVDLLRLVV